jgi:hypothetical protein
VCVLPNIELCQMEYTLILHHLPLRQVITFERNVRSLCSVPQKKGLVQTFLLSYSTYGRDLYTVTTVWHNGTLRYIMPYSGTNRFFTGSA